MVSQGIHKQSFAQIMVPWWWSGSGKPLLKKTSATCLCQNLSFPYFPMCHTKWEDCLFYLGHISHPDQSHLCSWWLRDIWIKSWSFILNLGQVWTLRIMTCQWGENPLQPQRPSGCYQAPKMITKVGNEFYSDFSYLSAKANSISY